MISEEELAEYEKRTGNLVVRVGTELELQDKRIGRGNYIYDISGTYTVIDYNDENFVVANSEEYWEVLWKDVCGQCPEVLVKKLKY